MAFAIDFTTNFNFSATETADSSTSPGSSSGGAARTFDAYKKTQTLRSATPTVPAPFRIVDLSKTTAAADTDIDLTAAPSAADLAVSIDLTGKKLIGYVFAARSSNVGTVTIKPHPTTNPYPLFGASGLVVLGPGERIYKNVDSGSPTSAPAVAGAVKVIRYTVGTVGDKVDCHAVFGT